MPCGIFLDETLINIQTAKLIPAFTLILGTFAGGMVLYCIGKKEEFYERKERFPDSYFDGCFLMSW